MASHNRVVIMGRTTREPEVRYTQKGDAVASFTIACDRKFKAADGSKKTDFFRCSVWRQQAEFVQKHMGKGKMVIVDGTVEINEYTDRDGAKRTSVDIQCSNVELIEWKNDDERAEGGGSDDDRPAAASAKPAAAAPAVANHDFDDEDVFGGQ